jgi:hypothetical protein
VSMISNQDRPPRIILCHFDHENDAIYRENIFEFLTARGIDHEFRQLEIPYTQDELVAYREDPRSASLLGFNSQLDHSWLGDEPLIQAAGRHHIPVTQWILDHPSGRWPEFNCSNPATSRFLFNSRYSQSYFEKFCCAGAVTSVAGSVGPSRRSRSSEEGVEAFSRRPIGCLIALGLVRRGVSAEEIEANIEALDPPLARMLRQAISRVRFELDQPLEGYLIAGLDENRQVADKTTFNMCFRLLNDSVQHFRRSFILRIASRFRVHIQSDAAALPLIEVGPASFRQGVSTRETLDSMSLCRAVLSVSPVNDSIHDRTCNALNAGCLPILEDNRAHRGWFTHGRNALLFRYNDDSLAECLNIASGDPAHIYPIAENARKMRDQEPFRFGFFPNIVALSRKAA